MVYISSSHADNADFPESLSSSLPIICFSHLVLCLHRDDIIKFLPTLLHPCVGVHRRTSLKSCP